jgi:repressor LexA
MTNNMGTIIKKRREQLGISQEQLANILGYKSRSSINKIELNHTDLPQSKIVALAKALSVTPAYLMGWEELEQPIPKSNGYPTVRIPVLGDVAAGVPILAQQDIIGYEDIPADMAKTGEYFGLKIKGDSMEPKIHDNDIVIVKSMSDAENNDIVIAMINNEATCKRLHKYSNSVVLTAINSDYKPIEVTPDENIQILGKVVMSISKF